MTKDSPPEKKEGRLARHVRVARQLHKEPRSAITQIRSWLLGLWQARGGGLYGLGFVITFVYLEIEMFVGDFSDSSFADAVQQEVIQFVLRIGYQSFINGFMALIWPAYLLQYLDGWGIGFFIIGVVVFEKYLRPLIETWFPELKETRLQKEQLKRDKKMKKENKKNPKH